MGAVHNSHVSRAAAVFVTIMLELLFGFLGGWTLYDAFLPWGIIPGIIVGALAGVTLFVLSLYVMIYREYAVEAIKIFSARRQESPTGRLAWSIFVVAVVLVMDSAFNADRMVTLPAVSAESRVFMWIALQALIFVPVALGVMVHAHVNTTDVQAVRRSKFVTSVDNALYARIEQVLPTLSPTELIALRQGDIKPLQARLDAVEADKRAIAAPEAPHPLALALERMQTSTERSTEPQKAVK